MTEITFDKLHAFVVTHGKDIHILDRSGTTRKFDTGRPDVHDLIAKADRFCVDERWYTREAFAAFLDSVGKVSP